MIQNQNMNHIITDPLSSVKATPSQDPARGVNEKRKVFMRVDERLFYIFRTSGDFASVHERSTHGGTSSVFHFMRLGLTTEGAETPVRAARKEACERIRFAQIGRAHV